jgi:3-oxoacyl-[acyl-carrier protein] reductase
MDNDRVILITGTSRGIGRFLVEYYAGKGSRVVGCSRHQSEFQHRNYRHFCLDIADEPDVKAMFAEIGKSYARLDILINNAGIASMNHVLLTPLATVKKIFETNYLGTFLFCREAAKLMRRKKFGRIVNFTTVAAALDLEGEAAYAASKAAVATLTRILARELAAFNITVNAIGPTPVKTDLIRSLPEEKLDKLIRRQAIQRYSEFSDISNVIDFFLRPESDFVTGQIIYLGGI